MNNHSVESYYALLRINGLYKEVPLTNIQR